jgi:hypothetical protein
MAQAPPLTRGVKQVALCAIALIALLATPVSAQGAEKSVMPDLTWGISDSDFARTQAAITDIGAEWVRLEFRWNEGEPREGRYSDGALAEWDQAVATAQAAGTKIIGMVHRSPTWASGTNDTYMPPADAADYADFIRFLAGRYRGKVAGWEVWNEQNISRFWPSGPNAAEYVELLKAAYPAVKAGDPNALVVFGGLAHSDYYYVTAAYKAGAQGYFDVMATHPYPGRYAPDNVWYNGDLLGKNTFLAYREVRRRMLARGDDKPIWFTEMGWSTCTTHPWCVTEAQQADYLTRAYCILEQDPYVQVATWYNLRNNHWDNDADRWETQLGLMKTTFERKPSYYAYKNYGVTQCPEINLPAGSDPVHPEPEPASEPVAEEPASDEALEATVASADRPTYRVRVRIVRRHRLRAQRDTRFSVKVVGRVRGADSGRVVIRLGRRTDDGRWRRKARFRARVGGNGRFARRVRRLAPGRWRVRAVYRVRGARDTRSQLVRFRG